MTLQRIHWIEHSVCVEATTAVLELGHGLDKADYALLVTWFTTTGSWQDNANHRSRAWHTFLDMRSRLGSRVLGETYAWPFDKRRRCDFQGLESVFVLLRTNGHDDSSSRCLSASDWKAAGSWLSKKHCSSSFGLEHSSDTPKYGLGHESDNTGPATVFSRCSGCR